LAKWLDAKFFISQYCPVPIAEYVVFDNVVYPVAALSRAVKTTSKLGAQTQTQGSTLPAPGPHRKILPSPCKEFNNPLINAVVSLANEYVLLFVPFPFSSISGLLVPVIHEVDSKNS
jgi:hypothetical protein